MTLGEHDLRAVIVTFRRPEELRARLLELTAQTRRPARTWVIDNAAQEQVRDICSSSPLPGVEYVSSPDNLGPAGGIKLGIDAALADGFDGWVLLVDDDDPPPSTDTIERLVNLIESSDHPRLGGVGIVGSRFDLRTGVAHRVLDGELGDGSVVVDYVGGGQCPIYRAAALRDARAFDPGLFWGFDDLDAGLSLGRAGWVVLVDGPHLLEHRARKGRLGLPATRDGADSAEAPWRRYYTSRNLVVIARRFGTPLAPVRVSLRVTAGAALRAARRGDGSAQALRHTLKGVVDGWRGALGRRLDPPVK